MGPQKQKIIVVDDDEGMNQALVRLLNAAGFHAVTFSSAEELLQADGAKDAACLILDIHLPGLSGFELRRRLVQAGTTAPVIFVTAFDDPDFQTTAAAAGAIACFTKPFQGPSLFAAVTNALKEGQPCH